MQIFFSVGVFLEGLITMDDTREFLMSVGNQSAEVTTSRGLASFQSSGSFIVNNLKQDKVVLSRRSLIISLQALSKTVLDSH